MGNYGKLFWVILLSVGLISPFGYANQEVDELKHLVEQLSQRVSDLEKQLAQRSPSSKKAKAVAHKQPLQKPKSLETESLTLVGAEAPLPVPAVPEKEPKVHPGNERVKLALSGQVNRGVLFGDNGRHSQFMHVDNDTSATKFLLHGRAKASENFTIGSNIEAQMESNSTYDVDIGGSSTQNTAVSFTDRKLEVFVEHPHVGTIWLGQGNTASDGTSEIDLSGTSVVAIGASAEQLAGGLTFREPTTPITTKGPKILEVWNPMDGLGRADRIRYDTPLFYGLQLSMSHLDGNSQDIALKFAGEYNKIRLEAAAAAAKRHRTFSQYNGSASILFSCGISAGFALGSRDPTRSSTTPHSRLTQGKLGYQRQWWSFGKTAVAIDYGHTRSLAQYKDKTKLYGIFLVQYIDPAATELYWGLRWHELDRLNRNYNTITASLLGARVKF